MNRRQAIAIGLGWCGAAAAQNSEREAPEPIAVSTEHPRILLTPQRLRLLRRERERRSGRWQQFEAYMLGRSPMPERGLADALYFRIAGDEEAGKRAVAWAVAPSADVRQSAIVFDWCRDLLTKQQAAALTAKLQRAIAQSPADRSIGLARTRALAAIALADEIPKLPERELERLVREWWERGIVKGLRAGENAVPREDAFALFEMLHVVRDSCNHDMREAYPLFFKEFPIEHLLSHYPASYPGPDNEYRIGASAKIAEPDLRQAALSRAAELAMVAYDVNAPASQVLQGWLMHDRFLLRGAFGIVYEFLWANPYQPGLSYYHVPLIYHNPDSGKLFIRSSWDEAATWFGWFNGTAQLFHEGKVTALDPRLNAAPLELTEARVIFARDARRFRIRMAEEEDAVFLVGLAPRRTYLVEIDQEEAWDAASDAGGILPLDLPRNVEVGVRMKELDIPVRQRDRSKEPLERIRQRSTPRAAVQ